MLNLPTFIPPSEDDLFQKSSIVHNCQPGNVKPEGMGTLLGLSLSYSIVKAHGGEIKVETKEGEGREFIIQLPANN